MVKTHSNSWNLVSIVRDWFHITKSIPEDQQNIARGYIYHITQAKNLQEAGTFYNLVENMLSDWEKSDYNSGEIDSFRNDADLAAQGDIGITRKYYSFKPTSH